MDIITNNYLYNYLNTLIFTKYLYMLEFIIIHDLNFDFEI